jgi:DNA invertase Pin-like site-specific DNA recombinase
MSEISKITADQLRRSAIVYVRQSHPSQVENNRESTDRQYRLFDHAVSLGWNRDQVRSFGDDQGVTGSGLEDRTDFTRLIADVA